MKNILICVLLCISTIGIAQEDFTVTAIDFETNQPIANITITLTNITQGISLENTTDLKGKAIFRSIPVLNNYSVTFNENDQYYTYTKQQIDVRSNENPSIQIALLKKGAETTLEEVQLSTTSSAKINRRDAEVAFELKAKEIEELPVEGRDITRVLFRLPNVSQATGFFPEAPNVSINGANPLFTSYLIDGMDNNERFLGGQRFAIPSGFVKDITVLTNNFSAEYGLTNNGVVDITTKSGTNEVTGEVFFITRPGPSIDGQTDFAQRDLSGNAVRDGFARYQAGLAVGGPIVKDKTFYYFNYEHTTDVKDNLLNVTDLGISETIRGNNTFDYFSAKIDQFWSSNFRSSLRANVGFVGIERQGGGLEGGVQFNSAANQQDRNSINIAFKNSYTLGNISAETNVQYSRFRWNYADPRDPNSPQVIVRNPAEETIAILGHPGFVFDALENTVQFQQKFKLYIKDHTLKAGLNYIRGDHELFGGGVPNGIYTVDLSTDQVTALRNQGVNGNLSLTDIPSDVTVSNYSVELRPTAFGTNQDIFSVYLEDQWAIHEKLNLTFGLRYDYDNLSKAGSDEGDYNNFAPRIHFNYQLNPKNTIRGGYAISYDKIPYAVYSDALQQNTTSADYRAQIQEFIDLGILPQDTNLDRVLFDGNIAANVSGVSYLQGPTASELQGQREGAFSNERRILNPNGFDNPFTHQFALGYQVQIKEDKLFFVDLVHNRSENLFRLRNLNAAAEYTINPDNVVVRTIEQADASRPIPIENGTATINGQTRTGIARNVVVSETEGKSRYYAASFNLQKTRGNDNYAYRINYTLSSLENDTEDINFRAQDANNYGSEFGPSINDRTHNINGIFNYYPLKGTTITLAALLQSGQPINRIPDAEVFGTTDLNGDGSGFGDAYVGNSDRFPGASRNSDRLPWSTNFDVSLQHQFALGNNKIEVRADIFNVFNTENLSGYSNNATQSNQIQQGSEASGRFVQRNAGPPRQFQFGIRYLF
ncbi:TonB-dependent receptor [Aquimarina algicola]|uniref:TonB-dependent receptor n=1 Tax=Aquimarina algicola TaxID=2589995 RepID=A0A504JKG3_9FLAO|nr:TonB-dependent receptor [Aquimarina algicola]TPN87239.1 TonB-dependent receptor [Aquimarina algicola]